MFHAAETFSSSARNGNRADKGDSCPPRLLPCSSCTEVPHEPNTSHRLYVVVRRRSLKTSINIVLINLERICFCSTTSSFTAGKLKPHACPTANYRKCVQFSMNTLAGPQVSLTRRRPQQQRTRTRGTGSTAGCAALLEAVHRSSPEGFGRKTHRGSQPWPVPTRALPVSHNRKRPPPNEARGRVGGVFVTCGIYILLSV